MRKTDNSTHQTIMYFRLLCSKRRIQFPPISPSVITMSKSERFENMQGRILPNFDESTSRILVDDELIAAFLYINSYGSMHERFPFEVTPAAAIKHMQKALDEYGMQVVAEARDLQQAADAAQAVESFIVANPDLDGVYIACSMGMNILDGTLSALEQYDPDNHIKISVIDFLTGLDTCFEKDRIICAQGGIYIPVQIACGMLEMNAILNGGRLGGQAWDVPISFGAVGSAEEFKDYSKFCEGALPTYTFEELQNLFITYNPDVTGEDIIAWGNAFNLADIYAAHADLAAPVKGPNGVEYVPFAK